MAVRVVRVGWVVSAVAAVAVGLAACGSSTPATPASPSAAPSGSSQPATTAATITIKGFAFGAPLTVTPGQKVEVVNQDSAPHTVTADDGSFDASAAPSGGTGSFTAPATPGSYAFHCSVHPNMHGTLTVVA